MGEILGIGMSHFPGMRQPGGGATNLERMLQRPDIPPESNEPKNWPAATSTGGNPIGRPAPSNAWGESPDTVFHIKGKREAAKYLARGLLGEKIDVAYAYEPLHYDGFAHAFLNTVMFLDWDRKGFEY